MDGSQTTVRFEEQGNVLKIISTSKKYWFLWTNFGIQLFRVYLNFWKVLFTFKFPLIFNIKLFGTNSLEGFAVSAETIHSIFLMLR